MATETKTTSDANATTNTKKKGRLSMKVKGLVKKKNKSKKSSSASVSSTSPATSAPTTSTTSSPARSTATSHRDDYTVAFDAATNASTTAPSASQSQSQPSDNVSPVGDPIHVILLLMDPTTRRFELLQLEFDSATARVSDITEQIPISATEPSLMGQKFETLTNLKGMELIAEEYIRLYVESAGVVVAVPTTTKEKGEAVARMATPILSNKKVHQMLTSSGLEIADLPEVRNKDVPPPPTVSIKPEEGEEVTSPSASASAAPVPTLNEEEPAEALSPAKKTRAIEFNLPEGDDLLVDDLLEEPEEEETKPEVQPSSKKPSSSGTGIVSFIAFLAIFVHLIQQIHIHYTTPLGPGAILSPGRTRGYCGIHSFSSGDCAPASMSMSDKGVFTVLDEASGDIVYQLKGKDAVCGSNPSCIPGLAIDGKGKVKINGSKAKVVVKAKVKLQPWPFAKGVVVPKRKAVVK